MGEYLPRFLVSVLLVIYPEMELLDHVLILSFFFFNCHIVSQSSISHQSCRIPISPHPYSHLIFCLVVSNGHLNGCEVIPHCGFDLRFPNK